MNTRVLRANILLFIAALVWGTTFVAQRVGMDHVGPLTFSGLRFLMGAVCLAPLAWYGAKRGVRTYPEVTGKWTPFWGIMGAGMLMALGINLQQIGLVVTTAGKAAFITGLYVIIVPFLGLIWRQKPGTGVWIGAPLGVAGLYLMSVQDSLSLAPGDGWVLACAFAWAVHVLYLGWISPRINSMVLAFGQALVCAILSLAIAAFTEDIVLSAIWATMVPLLYGGVMSVGVGFTLQIVAQRDSPPSHAAIILQLEAMIGAISGWIFLGETMSNRAIVGAALMLAGMLVAQLWALRNSESRRTRRKREAHVVLDETGR
ncbi:MAG: DMT family transporter [Desulfatibacillaceae bacterium]